MPLKIARRRSAIHGNGVFATGPITKGEPVVEYKGKLITHQEADDQRHADVTTGHTFLFTLNDHWIVDANQGGNVARWINQSCDPNCEVFIHEDPGGDPRKDKVIIEALRPIKPQEEITYDYGLVFDEEYTDELLRTWACRCGSRKCRGTMLKPKEEALAELMRTA